MSPSWNGKSPYNVIGVNQLPLQNEEKNRPKKHGRGGGGPPNGGKTPTPFRDRKNQPYVETFDDPPPEEFFNNFANKNPVNRRPPPQNAFKKRPVQFDAGPPQGGPPLDFSAGQTRGPPRNFGPGPGGPEPGFGPRPGLNDFQRPPQKFSNGPRNELRSDFRQQFVGPPQQSNVRNRFDDGPPQRLRPQKPEIESGFGPDDEEFDFNEFNENDFGGFKEEAVGERPFRGPGKGPRRRRPQIQQRPRLEDSLSQRPRLEDSFSPNEESYDRPFNNGGNFKRPKRKRPATEVPEELEDFYDDAHLFPKFEDEFPPKDEVQLEDLEEVTLDENGPFRGGPRGQGPRRPLRDGPRLPNIGPLQPGQRPFRGIGVEPQQNGPIRPKFRGQEGAGPQRPFRGQQGLNGLGPQRPFRGQPGLEGPGPQRPFRRQPQLDGLGPRRPFRGGQPEIEPQGPRRPTEEPQLLFTEHEQEESLDGPPTGPGPIRNFRNKPRGPLNELPPPRTKPGRRRPSFQEPEEIYHDFKPSFRPSQPVNLEITKDVDDRITDQLDAPPLLEGRPGPGPNRPRRKIRPFRGRYSTPRPIPLPGPEDFPPPPPSRRPRPPPTHPTHPTHPPLPTHPPTVNPPLDFFSDNFEDSPRSDTTAHDEDEGGAGFFEVPDSFPTLNSLGSGFESMKIRNKREAEPVAEPVSQRRKVAADLETGEQRHFPRRFRRNRGPQSGLRRGGHREQYRRQGEFDFSHDFWQDVNFDNDFFDEKIPHQGFGQRQKQPPSRQRGYNRNQRPALRPPFTPSGGGNRDQYHQQSIQSYPNNNDHSRKYSSGYNEKDNEILGSGNFEVIKGGTFYDEDTYYLSQYNRRPSSNYYGGDIFENFRDFADIKDDLYRYKKKK